MPQQPKKQVGDWHIWDIKAALGKKGYTITRVALENGYKRASAYDVLRKRWPAMERIFADIIGVKPWEIWPSRYDALNQPIQMQPGRPTTRRSMGS
ncbi:MAG: transcriptional regulator [Desulfobulbus sp.]